MKRVYALLIISMFSIAVFAQASGGQITRKKVNTTMNSRAKKTHRNSQANTSNERPISGIIREVQEFVDLGLPSGTLWATHNIGANSPEQYGDYFAWGETTGYNSGKTDFSWITYKWGNGSYGSLTKYNTVGRRTELDFKDDAAYVNWGSDWRIPTIEQFEELINSTYTTTMWTELKGVNGYKITSKKNGKSIFLPAAGYRNSSSLINAGSCGNYWTLTLKTSSPNNACRLFFNSAYIYTSNGGRCFGQSVRPVYQNFKQSKRNSVI